MNTRLGKSFGLAFVVAVGILALMFALGTFNAQQAGAQTAELTVSDVKLEVADHTPTTAASPAEDGPPAVAAKPITVKFTLSRDAVAEDQIAIGILGLVNTIPGSATATGPGRQDEDGEDISHTINLSAVSGGATLGEDSWEVATYTFADLDTDTDDYEGFTKGEVTIQFTSGLTTPTTAANARAAVAVGANIVAASEMSDEVGVGVTVDTDTASPGAVARIIVEVGAGEGAAVDAGTLEEIVIDMGKFGLPATIDEDDVSLRGLDLAGTGQTGRGTPDNVNISGTKVTITVDDMNQAEDSPSFEGLSPHFRIIFSKGAAITIPAIAGSYSVKIVQVTDEDAADTKYGESTDGVASNALVVKESLSIKPDKGSTGTEVTVTGKGFGNDITSLFIDKDRRIADDPNTEDVDESEGVDSKPQNGTPDSDEYEIATNIDVDNGAFTHTFTIDSNFSGTSHINVLKTNGVPYRTGAHDEDADPPNVYPTFTVTGSMSLSTDSAQPGEEITVSLAGFSAGSASATIGRKTLFTPVTTTGESQDIPAEIPTGLTVGKHQVKVTVVVAGADDETGTADITIGGLPLTVDPDTAVPGQEITIRGSGFTGGAKLATVMVGGKPVSEQANGQEIEDLIINNGGTFVLSVDIPKDVTSEGSNVVVEVVESGNARSGVTKMTIPEPTLTLNPTEGRMDTSVVASGTGFGAGENVSIIYTAGDEDSTTSVTADSRGNWTKAFTVPLFAGVGGENMVTAKGSSAADKSVSTEHMTPGASIEVSPESGRPGITVTITGIDFQAYSSVTSVTIGGLTIPSSGVNTDEDGNFTMTGLLPGLAVGTHSLVVEVGSGTSVNRDSVVFTVTEAGPATLPSADVFEPLATAGVLTVVWYFDNDTKGWSFYDPRPEVAAAVDLTEVTSGDNVWIQVTADVDFQGEMLTTGWNNITLD